MSSFTPTSNSAVLANGSRTPVQGVGSAATFIISLSSVLYLPHFSLSLLSVSKISKALNYTVTFFLDRCVFQELGKETIGTGREQNKLYELELVPNQVAYISTSSAFNYHC